MPHADTGADVTARALARVEAARARADAATPGPWRVMVKGNTVQSLAIFGVCSGISSKTGNASFIAHSRADVPLLATIAAAAVRLTMRDGDADYPWWYLSDECVGCLRGSSGLAEWGDFVHGPNCPAAALDAAIRAAGEAQP